VLSGPLLAARAAERACRDSMAYGDQPASSPEMVDWARARAQVRGAGKGTQVPPGLPLRSRPTTCWSPLRLTPDEAARRRA
jgi:predicted homoserine dehydrogenase-like protein